MHHLLRSPSSRLRRSARQRVGAGRPRGAGGGDRAGAAATSPPRSPTWSPPPIRSRSRPAWRCCAPGGSAADAAIAVQLVLNLVEPQSSGLGGGAFILHWDAAGRQLKGYDGRETAPAAATADRFLVDGRPRKFDEAVFGGLSVGVPGTLRALEAVHKPARPAAVGAAVRAGDQARRGRLSRLPAPAPAAALARRGELRAGGAAILLRSTGSARPAGYLLKNPEFAATLRAIAERRRGRLLQGRRSPRRSSRPCARPPTIAAT